MSDLGPPERSTGEDTRNALAAVLRDVEEREARQRAGMAPKRAPESRRTGLWALSGFLALVLAWLLLAPPGWAVPTPPPAPGPQAMEDGLRMDLYAASLRIRAFSDSAGRLPLTLLEALQDPLAGEDIEYTQVSRDVYRLEGDRGGFAVIWRSDEGSAALLGTVRQRMDVDEP